MLDVVAEILGLILGPSAWRKMAGPAVLSGAFAFGLIGILFTGGGWLLTLYANSRAALLLGWVAASAGLWLLADVVAGVIAFFRAHSERT